MTPFTSLLFSLACNSVVLFECAFLIITWTFYLSYRDGNIDPENFQLSSLSGFLFFILLDGSFDILNIFLTLLSLFLASNSISMPNLSFNLWPDFRCLNLTIVFPWVSPYITWTLKFIYFVSYFFLITLLFSWYLPIIFCLF